MGWLAMVWMASAWPVRSAEAMAADSVYDTAHALRLQEDPEWLALGHYRPDGQGWKSTVDDPQFFLSARGKTDPEAELDATLQAFWSTGTNVDSHVSHRFVARLAWIRERCSLSEDAIPSLGDTSYERLLAEVRPTKIILAFPAPLADSVSSSFGHLFLIFVHEGRSPLLAPTVSYAALMDGDGSIWYPVLGLTGGLKHILRSFLMRKV